MQTDRHEEKDIVGQGGVTAGPTNADEKPLSARKAADVIRARFGVQVSDQSLLNWTKNGQMSPGTGEKNDPVRWVRFANERYFYPAACAEWIARNKPQYGTHGGKRPGVGRKKRPVVAADISQPDVIDAMHQSAEESRVVEEQRRVAEEERRRRERLTDPSLLADAMRPEAAGGMSLVEAQRLKLIAEARVKTLEAEQLERSVLPKDEVERSVGELCQVLRDGLEAAPEEIAGEAAVELGLGSDAAQIVADAARQAIERAMAGMHAAAQRMAEAAAADAKEAA